MKGQISSDQCTVYWENPSGEVMLAPHTRMRPFPGWRRVECHTLAETEQFSRRMAAQEYQKFKTLKVEEHLRSQKRRDELKANCRLRLASGCISPEDERMTRETLRSLERKDEAMYALIADQSKFNQTCLAIEKSEQNTAYQGRKKELSDADLNQINRIAEMAL